MPSIKDRILEALLTREPVNAASELIVPCGTDQHNITHVLWRLQKQGLITFAEMSPAGIGRRVPTKIRLTEAGRQRALSQRAVGK